MAGDWADEPQADEFDEADDLDVFEEAEINCGSRRKWQCDLAGTEYCDWSCPLRDEVLPPRKARR